jgi:hypothetical protein
MSIRGRRARGSSFRTPASHQGAYMHASLIVTLSINSAGIVVKFLRNMPQQICPWTDDRACRVRFLATGEEIDEVAILTLHPTSTCCQLMTYLHRVTELWGSSHSSASFIPCLQCNSCSVYERVVRLHRHYSRPSRILSLNIGTFTLPGIATTNHPFLHQHFKQSTSIIRIPNLSHHYAIHVESADIAETPIFETSPRGKDNQNSILNTIASQSSTTLDSDEQKSKEKILNLSVLVSPIKSHKKDRLVIMAHDHSDVAHALGC